MHRPEEVLILHRQEHHQVDEEGGRPQPRPTPKRFQEHIEQPDRPGQNRAETDPHLDADVSTGHRIGRERQQAREQRPVVDVTRGEIRKVQSALVGLLDESPALPAVPGRDIDRALRDPVAGQHRR